MVSQVSRPHEALWAHPSPKHLRRYVPFEALENVLVSSSSGAVSQFALESKQSSTIRKAPLCFITLTKHSLTYALKRGITATVLDYCRFL